MEYQTIMLDVADGLAVLTINRPDKMNALNTLARAEIAHAMRALAKTERVIVITGAGDVFCTGQDLGAADGPPDLERTLRDEYGPLLEAIHDCPIPTIAAVNGPAAGAGANIALAADVVIAAESAYFLQAFTRIGLMPDAGGTWLLPRQIGLAKAMGVSLFGEKISARKAEQWGMIWEAVPDAEFGAHWRARAQQLAQGPTMAYARIKESIRKTYDNTLEEQLTLEAHLQGECGRSRDFMEGVTAFMANRPAKFEGR